MSWNGLTFDRSFSCSNKNKKEIVMSGNHYQRVLGPHCERCGVRRLRETGHFMVGSIPGIHRTLSSHAGYFYTSSPSSIDRTQ